MSTLLYDPPAAQAAALTEPAAALTEPVAAVAQAAPEPAPAKRSKKMASSTTTTFKEKENKLECSSSSPEEQTPPIPTVKDANTFPSRPYSWTQLKFICRQLKIKVTGNKTALTGYIQQHLRQMEAVLKIQRWWWRHIWRRFTALRGPARFKRSLCVNDDDFFTLDAVADIPLYQFISYAAAEDGVVYGFDVMSLFNLVTKSSSYTDQMLNPYNRAPLREQPLIQNLMALMRYSTLLAKASTTHNGPAVKVRYALTAPPSPTTTTTTTTPPQQLQPIILTLQQLQLQLDQRLITLFHDMDTLGNYTDPRWFVDLQRLQLVKFLTDLRDLWVYRLNLSTEIKRTVCPHGSLLHDIPHLVNMNMELTHLQLAVVHVMENFVRSGINRDSRCLGTTYVLCALTLVSPAAAMALPWLYESVV